MIDQHEPRNISRLKITPTVIPRSQHIISRTQINDNALKVLYRLKNAKYKAYLVGGAVRDILLGKFLKVNPFDQPAVETIKKRTKNILLKS